MNSKISNHLFNEFSDLVNHDLETRIRENEKSLGKYENDKYSSMGKEYVNNIENLMVKFYSSISNIINVHIDNNDKKDCEYNYDRIKQTFEKIILTYKPGNIRQD